MVKIGCFIGALLVVYTLVLTNLIPAHRTVDCKLVHVEPDMADRIKECVLPKKDKK